MQPVVQPITLVAGDSLSLIVRLYQLIAGESLPLDLSPGEVFGLSVDWPGNRIVSTTADAPTPNGLRNVPASDATQFVRVFTPQDTARLLGQPVIWSLYRLPAQGERRTYVTGPVNVQGPGAGGAGDLTLQGSVVNGTLTVSAQVLDPASYTDAREAVIRQDLATAIDGAKKYAAAAALILG